jgi:hypothetical protein
MGDEEIIEAQRRLVESAQRDVERATIVAEETQGSGSVEAYQHALLIYQMAGLNLTMAQTNLNVASLASSFARLQEDLDAHLLRNHAGASEQPKRKPGGDA